MNPIGSKEDIIKIAELIGEKTTELVQRTIGRELPISYLTIFSHSPHEYKRFVEWANDLGTQTEANNGIKFLLRQPIHTRAGDVRELRIRKPDPYRSQIGCADFKVQDYISFKARELPNHSDNLRLIERPTYEMLEFYDFEPNDVLAYVVSN